MNKIRWSVRRARDGIGWQGEVLLPSGLLAGAKAPTKKQALAKASTLASRIVDDPIVSSLLPPGSKLAVKALSGAMKSGVGKAALKGLRSFF